MGARPPQARSCHREARIARRGDPSLRSLRGSALLTGLLFAVGIAAALGGYLMLSRTTLKTAHRTFFANDALNLAEAGVEQALYSFNLMVGGLTSATAWNGWTISGSNATRTLSPFNRDQNAIGVVKVFVKGHDGTDANPYIVSQARITPFDGSAPLVKTVIYYLNKKTSPVAHTLVGLEGVTITNGAWADAFNSNPLALLSVGPYLPYTLLTAFPGASVVALSGTVDISSGTIFGDLYLGSGVTAPDASRVSGSIVTNYTATFPFPTYPTAASVSRSYDLGTSVPLTLPRLLDLPASDGRYYYFVRNTTLAVFAVGPLSNVTIVGTNTGMNGGVTVPVTSTLQVYIDKPVNLTGGAILNLLGAPDGLQIYTTTTSTCTIGDGTQITGILMAPNAPLVASGTSLLNNASGFYLGKTVYASGTMSFHYDASLPPLGITTIYGGTRWLDLQSAADRAAVPGLTGGFLP